MSTENRKSIFEKLGNDYDQDLHRQRSEQIEIEELGDANGPAVWHIKKAPAWTQHVYGKHQDVSNVLFAAGYIVVHAHDMFGEPIFYDREINGRELSLNEQLQQLEDSKELLAMKTKDSLLVDIFNKATEASRKLNEETPSVEDLKENSTTETDG